MSRGKRYNHEPKLNMKKVVAVIVAFILIIMFVMAIKSLLSSDSSASKLVSTTYFVINKDNATFSDVMSSYSYILHMKLIHKKILCEANILSFSFFLRK